MSEPGPPDDVESGPMPETQLSAQLQPPAPRQPSLAHKRRGGRNLVRFRELHLESFREEEGGQFHRGLSLRSLVTLPRLLYRTVRLFFGATRQAVPWSAIIGCVVGIFAVGALAHNLYRIMAILTDAFDVQLSALVNFVRVMNTVVLGVDGAVLAHGTIVSVLVVRRYLCGPRGKLHLAASGDPDFAGLGACSRLCLRLWCLCCCCSRWACCCCKCLLRWLLPSALVCFLHALRATIRGAFAVATAVLLWLSILLLIVLVIFCCFFFVMVLAIGAVCGALDPATALAFSAIGDTFDQVSGAFEQSGIVSILESMETQTARTFWFLPFDAGLSDAVQTSFDVSVRGFDRTINATQAYEDAVDAVCDPFLEMVPYLRWAVLLALAAICGQILALVSHHQTYTVWFYELRLAYAETSGDGVQHPAAEGGSAGKGRSSSKGPSKEAVAGRNHRGSGKSPEKKNGSGKRSSPSAPRATKGGNQKDVALGTRIK